MMGGLLFCSLRSGRILFGATHFIAGGGWLLDHCWRANSATRGLIVGADCIFFLSERELLHVCVFNINVNRG
tara:strand:- start:373 stop:588 length:216 start_codon:yes stop_codon:yes gene_type:complete